MAGVRVEQPPGELREWQKLGLSRHWAELSAAAAIMQSAVIGSIGLVNGGFVRQHARRQTGLLARPGARRPSIGFIDALRRHAWHVLVGLTWGTDPGVCPARHRLAVAGDQRPGALGANYHVHEPHRPGALAAAASVAADPGGDRSAGKLAALQTGQFRLPAPPAVGETAAAREPQRDLEHRVPARAPLAMKTQPLHDAIAAHRWRWPIPWRKN